AGGGPAHGVTAETPGHPRQLLAGGELDLVDHPVALGTADVAVEVRPVVHPQVGRRDDQFGDSAIAAGVGAQVAVAALPVLRAPGHHRPEIAVVDVVAVVAGLDRIGQEPIGAVGALVGGGVADA